MGEYLIKKLGHQELGYSKGIPGKRGGQYFLVSKEHLEFFPPLKKEIAQHLQILNLVSHGSEFPSQAKYIYNNDKYHGSTAKTPRDEHRINLNKNVNPEKEVYLEKDIIIFKREFFINEDNNHEKAYVITRFRKADDPIDYEYLESLLNTNSINYQSKNYCFASRDELLKLEHHNDRLFNRVLSESLIIPQVDKTLIKIKQSNLDTDENENKALENQIKRLVFDQYEYRCLVTGIGFMWRELEQIKNSWKGITGAHIKPRAHDGPYSSDNIIPLLEPIHQLFDRGVFTIDENLRIELHPDALQDDLLTNFHEFHGKPLSIPKGIKLSNEYLSHHKENVFGNFTTGQQIRSLG